MDASAALDTLSLDDILMRLDGGHGADSASVMEILLQLAGDAQDEINIEADDLINALRAANRGDVAGKIENIIREAAEVDGMDFAGLEDNWTRFGATDPLWSILTDASKRDNRWDVEEFFATGRRYATELFDYLAQHDIECGRGRALDFGCGVGRLTQAFCPHFDAVVGVDVAATMIDRARELNSYGDACSYVHNSASDLRVFSGESFDLVNCYIVLQHMRPQYALSYIAEFLRILKPGGIAVFQIPAMPISALLDEDSDARLGVFSAELRTSPTTLSGMPGSRHALRVHVRNTGPTSWLMNRAFPINLGNHWLDANGGMLIFDDVRERIPRPLAPGEEAEMEMWVTLPETPGEYLLELDVVQERVSWFANHGPSAIRLLVMAVEPGRDRAPATISPAPPATAVAPVIGGPRMEMFGTPPERIVSWVGQHRGRILTMEQDWSAPDWYGYRYVVEKY